MGDTIIGVQFGIANPDDIVARSVVEVITDKTYTGNQAVAGGVFDARFGVIDNGKICPTCKQTNLYCPGHFGHIRLARPVYLYQFLDVIQKVLGVVCLACSNPYLPDAELERIEKQTTGVSRFDMVRDETTSYKTRDLKDTNACPHCGSQAVKKASKIENTVAALQAEFYTEGTEPMRLQPEIVLRCFTRISDRHVELLGFNPKFSRPDWMICTVLAVPPLTVRPSVVMDEQRMEDDLTHVLITIVRDNQRLRDKIDKGESAGVIDQHTDLLQVDVATYVDNDIKGMTAIQRSGRQLKTLKSRLGAKTGRVRGNLMGKRVDFSARSVITPDANIDLDELGVPEEIAMNLTYPEIVTAYNRDRLMSYVRNGPNKYPGAKSVKAKDEPRPYSLKYADPERLNLKEGDIVHRHLIDGDVVLFNRQPSLHKASMMCHRIRVLPYSTFRLNVSATKPYNADFDGDEMNMHVPQSITAATELKVIATLLRQIISPRLAGPIIGLFQDTGVGVFRISKPEVSIPEHIAMNILARTKKPLSNFKRLNKPMSGVDVISQAFPLTDLDGGGLIVKDGKLTKGLLHKTSIEKIVHHIYQEYGPERTAEFINAVQAIVTKFNMYTCFSTGPSDLIANAEVYSKISEILEKGKKEVSAIMSSVHSGTFLNNSGRADGEELEKQITNKLNDINSSIATDAVDSLPASNRIIQMSNKGADSKGKEFNIVQMVGLLGQQNVDGRRIEYTMDNRTLPHFAKFEDGPQARGFVENSFIAGIRPAEFFFHAMAGRQGLIDTAVKTSDTGYIQRKLVKSMEDIHVAYDGTVRDVTGAIVQFAYGDDGIDSIYVEKQECDLGTLTMEQVYERFAASRSDYEAVMNEAPSSSPPDFVEQILKDRDMLVKHVIQYDARSGIVAPVSMKKLTKKYTNNYNTKTDLTPEYVIEELNKLCNEPYIRNNKLFHVLVRYYLAPKQSMIVLRMNKELFQEALREIRYKYIRSMVHAGEMVGPIAAQSIGEPTTQLTLNTFHKTGTTSANGTKGVPRIQELLSVSHNPKNPSNIVYLTTPRGLTQDGAITKMKEIQKTTLRDITKSVRIYYDPKSMSSNTLVAEDREILQMYEKFSVGADQNCASPWIMRLELDIQSMLARSVNDMTMVQTKIRNNKGLRVFDCMSSDINKDSKLMLRITFANDTVKNALALRFVEDKLLDTVLTGVDGIGRVFTREIPYELSYDEKIGGYKKQTQYVLDTEGTNLLDLMVFPDVDHRKTTSTDIHEILEVFGIEACRQVLYREFTNVFEGEKVNYHHLSVLVDTMTYHGQLVSTDRFGMNKNDSGVLARSSFEMTSKVLFDAAISGEFDPMKGVSANIMFGQKPPCGTGFVDILVDESRLPDGAEEEIDTEEADLAHANALVKAATEHGDCKLEDITMAW